MDEKVYEISLKKNSTGLLVRRKFIFKVTGIFLLIGIAVYFLNFKKSEYTAEVVLPQQNSSEIQSLGLLFDNEMKGYIIEDKMYSKAIASPSFSKELMVMDIYIPNKHDSVAFLEYWWEVDAQQLSLVGKFKRNIVNLIKREDKPFNKAKIGGDSIFSAKEISCVSFLKNSIRLSGPAPLVIVKAPDAVAASGLAQNVLRLLEKYIKDTEISYFDSQLGYLQRLYEEVQLKIGYKQQEIIDFDKQNLTSITVLQKSRLNEEYKELCGFSIELEQQILEINVFKNYMRPIISETNLISKPVLSVAGGGNLFWIISFLFLGFAMGIFLVLTLPHIAALSGGKCFRNWLYNEDKTGIN